MLPSQPDGFLVMPSANNGKAVLVLHAWWGLNDTIKAFCTRLAESGFIAFAPDLYHGKVTDSISDAETLSSPLFAEKHEQARGDVANATVFLYERANHPQGGLTVIGFSLGAFFALDASVADPEHIRSVVVFYGTRPGDYSNSKAEYLGHFAELDDFEPPAQVDEFETSLKRAQRPAIFYRYDGVGHWFFEPDRTQAYNEVAANLAWDRTLIFLNRPFSS